MAIPSSQLDTWANLGGTTASTQAYSTIRSALESSSSRIAARAPEIFLQGSYRNVTNIYGDSDVDIVVQLNASFHYDWTALPTSHREHHQASYSDATYTWHNWKADVLQALADQFGATAVKSAKKSIKVNLGAGRREADVVPVLQFRKYTQYTPADGNFHFYPGVQLFDSAGNVIINYPKLHISNGEDKNSAARTGGRYKETVRMFKNMRNCSVDRGILARDVSPSYFIECLLYNVPDELFTADRSQRILGILRHVWTLSSTGLMCQNGLQSLIGTSPAHWTDAAYTTFVQAVVKLWDNW